MTSLAQKLKGEKREERGSETDFPGKFKFEFVIFVWCFHYFIWFGHLD